VVLYGNKDIYAVMIRRLGGREQGSALQAALRRPNRNAGSVCGILPYIRSKADIKSSDYEENTQPMTTRVAKLLLLCGIALFYTLIVFNNLTDFDSNYQFVRHVLMMDTTFPGNLGMWRALSLPAEHLLFYWSTIVWEIASMVSLWFGAWKLFRALSKPAAEFRRKKQVAVAALTLSLLMWLVAFLSVGGEWFLMWQSKTWNGQEAAFRMFTVVGLVLILMIQTEGEEITE
jgi:predicted small integral membrane protein